MSITVFDDRVAQHVPFSNIWQRVMVSKPTHINPVVLILSSVMSHKADLNMIIQMRGRTWFHIIVLVSNNILEATFAATK